MEMNERSQWTRKRRIAGNGDAHRTDLIASRPSYLYRTSRHAPSSEFKHGIRCQQLFLILPSYSPGSDLSGTRKKKRRRRARLCWNHQRWVGLTVDELFSCRGLALMIGHRRRLMDPASSSADGAVISRRQFTGSRCNGGPLAANGQRATAV